MNASAIGRPASWAHGRDPPPGLDGVARRAHSRPSSRARRPGRRPTRSRPTSRAASPSTSTTSRISVRRLMKACRTGASGGTRMRRTSSPAPRSAASVRSMSSVSATTWSTPSRRWDARPAPRARRRRRARARRASCSSPSIADPSAGAAHRAATSPIGSPGTKPSAPRSGVPGQGDVAGDGHEDECDRRRRPPSSAPSRRPPPHRRGRPPPAPTRPPADPRPAQLARVVDRRRRVGCSRSPASSTGPSASPRRGCRRTPASGSRRSAR